MQSLITSNETFILSYVGSTQLFQQEVNIGSKFEDGKQIFVGIRQWAQGVDSKPLKNTSLDELIADINGEITQSRDWLKISQYEIDAIQMRVHVADK